MGVLARAVRALVPEHKTAVAATVPVGQADIPQYPQQTIPYLRLAREGYGQNEVIYAAIEELCTSAAEPRIAAYKGQGKHREQIETHPLVDLLNRPNPWMDGYSLIAGMILHLSIGGNAYLEKVRSGASKVVELWPMRPDRVWVVPEARTYIGGYSYNLGGLQYPLDAHDVSHAAYRNPWDDWYGLAPLAVAARRTDTDLFMREFTGAFFRNAGVPAGLLNIQRMVNAAEREVIQQRFRGEFGGPQGWHRLLVLDNTEATFTPMGQSLGQRGLVLPELDEINEVRLAMCFGVPLELIGARISMLHGNRSTTREARATFWDETLVPLYRMIASRLTQDLVPEFGDCDEVAFDLSTVQALQEDADALMKRAVEGFAGGVLQRGEARKLVGQEATDDDKVFFVPRNAGLLDPDETLVPGATAPELVGTPPPEAFPAAPVPSNGHAADLAPVKLSEWALEQKALTTGAGLIVCLAVPERLAAGLALPGGEPADRLHATLAFLGAPTPGLVARVRRVVREVAAAQAPLVGALSGIGRFSGPVATEPDVLYVSLDVPGLTAFRGAVETALGAAGVAVSQAHGFTPHCTLAYLDRHALSPLTRIEPVPVVFEAVDVWSGDAHASYPLARMPALAGTNGTAH